ncbi:MAG: hypothetical protein V1916_01275, partial [Patescibacteria group bacterium]
MRVEKEPPKPVPVAIPPQPIGKVALLACLAVAGALLLWLTWRLAITTGTTWAFGSRSISVVVTTLLAFCLSLSLYAIAALAIRRKVVVLCVAVAAALTILPFFKLTIWTLIAAAVLALAYLTWWRELRSDADSRIKFIPRRIVDTGLKTAVTVVLLAASLVYYSATTSEPGSQARFRQRVISSGSTVTQNLLTMFYKDKFRSRDSLDQFIRNMNPIKAGEVNVTTGRAEVDRVISQNIGTAEQLVVDQERQAFLDSFGIQASGSDEVGAVVTKVVTKNVDQYLGQYLR